MNETIGRIVIGVISTILGSMVIWVWSRRQKPRQWIAQWARTSHHRRLIRVLQRRYLDDALIIGFGFAVSPFFLLGLSFGALLAWDFSPTLQSGAMGQISTIAARPLCIRLYYIVEIGFCTVNILWLIRLLLDARIGIRVENRFSVLDGVTTKEEIRELRKLKALVHDECTLLAFARRYTEIGTKHQVDPILAFRWSGLPSA